MVKMLKQIEQSYVCSLKRRFLNGSIVKVMDSLVLWSIGSSYTKKHESLTNASLGLKKGSPIVISERTILA